LSSLRLRRLPITRLIAIILLSAGGCLAHAGVAIADGAMPDPCPRPQSSSAVPEPRDLRSHRGVLTVDLTVHNYREQDGTTRYCYVLPDGSQSPTLRLHPGDQLVLRLKNDLTEIGVPAAAVNAAAPAEMASTAVAHRHGPAAVGSNPCTSGAMTATSTNLHFHGLTVPPVCHQDEVLKTSIQPNEPPFEYRFRIPANEPPGLYWYHPHIHGFSSVQVSGGASGALVIEGLERANSEVLGLPERVLVIRDQELLNPDAPPSQSEPVVPKLLDSDGDSANNNTGFGKPAKDLSINFVPVPYPHYPPASIKLKPGTRELWRVLNASSVTYLHLALLFDHVPQQLGVVAIDGVSINASGRDARAVAWADHIGLPPGGRVEFIMNGPTVGASGLFITRSVDTGKGGENDPNRALARVLASADAPEPHSRLPSCAKPLPPPALPWLGSVTPVRVRKLYFSETQSDPNDPRSPTTFFMTVDGEAPKVFDPTSTVPNIVVTQGDVEDWIIENRSVELHAFHIHQIHFLLLDWFGMPVNEPFLRDTVNVPYFDNRMLTYPSVRLRMDFRDPNTVGTFVYHCHLLEHEDGGMMGTIRVEPAGR
jgi:FtsP/CotA-like multicopper oxidase with cupredoxin domain